MYFAMFIGPSDGPCFVHKNKHIKHIYELFVFSSHRRPESRIFYQEPRVQFPDASCSAVKPEWNP